MGNTAESFRFFGHTMPKVDDHFRLPITVHIPGNLAEDEGYSDGVDGVVAAFSAPASGYIDLYDWFVGTQSGATDTVIWLINATTGSKSILTLEGGEDAAFGTAIVIDAVNLTGETYFTKGEVVQIDVQSSHGTHAVDTTMVFHMRV